MSKVKKPKDAKTIVIVIITASIFLIITLLLLTKYNSFSSLMGNSRTNCKMVSLNANGGKIPNLPNQRRSTFRICYGDKYGLLPIPVKISYKFLGWYRGNERVTANSRYQGETTLKAKYYRQFYNTKNKQNYRIVDSKIINNFVNFINNKKIVQTKNKKLNDKCLSLAEYYAYHLRYTSNTNNIKNINKAGDYIYDSQFKYIEKGKLNKNKETGKQNILKKIYNEINNNHPVVLQVRAYNSKNEIIRHYVTVIGYKSNVTSGANLRETDLLIIDNNDGVLETMDNTGTRRMIRGVDTVDYIKRKNNNYNYGYQILVFKK